MAVSGQRHAPAALSPGKRPDTLFTGCWVGPRFGQEGCGKTRAHLGGHSFQGDSVVEIILTQDTD
jgi:hypothetical protein